MCVSIRMVLFIIYTHHSYIVLDFMKDDIEKEKNPFCVFRIIKKTKYAVAINNKLMIHNFCKLLVLVIVYVLYGYS